jgi:hypothetical protein
LAAAARFPAMSRIRRNAHGGGKDGNIVLTRES